MTDHISCCENDDSEVSQVHKLVYTHISSQVNETQLHKSCNKCMLKNIRPRHTIRSGNCKETTVNKTNKTMQRKLQINNYKMINKQRELQRNNYEKNTTINKQMQLQ